jgi:hypothetical protein
MLPENIGEDMSLDWYHISGNWKYLFFFKEAR